ncbi:hypothetical protein DM860_002517 [Cuscuta australis]|uniref:J domain-containing protein n=1 Tax=Cuscuta australis TaxID=267555 RepID=A0A328D2C1_9ASTE|nr:hypothetical protein DM860_002517 [Cuscuta australis]
MESNKEEALRCFGIAKEAIASRNKEKALKFIKIARRLNKNLPVDDLLAACESINSSDRGASRSERDVCNTEDERDKAKVNEASNGSLNYTEENVQLIRQIKTERDYYAILGVEKSCSVDEIRKAYRKLSLKVHPDKNKAPGAEEAFKTVSKAFKCLSDDELRKQYDLTGLVDQFEHHEQYNNVRQRRRRTGNDIFDDNFDPDEIFRAFFGHSDLFRTAHAYRTRASGPAQREDSGRSGPNFLILLQMLPLLLIILLAYIPFSEPEYSLQKGYSYQFRKMTEKHGVEYFVKSADFDQDYPPGSAVRVKMEDRVVRDYKNVIGRYCHIELQRRQWNRNYPTPHCDRLRSFAVA